MFISASKDTTAKLWDMDQLENKKTYKTERPVNSASISPTKDHVVLGGGQVRNSYVCKGKNSKKVTTNKIIIS